MTSYWLRVTLPFLLLSSLYVVVGCEKSEIAEEEIVAAERHGGVYRYVLAHEPHALDPAKLRSIYSLSLAQQVFDGLVQFDADLNVIPSIAKFWTASPDGLTWRFTLRTGVVFHNGREVTAQDFVYSFTRLMHPETGSPYTWLFEHVQGVDAFVKGEAESIEGFRALDSHTLQITLSHPYVPFIRMLGVVFAKVVPREEVERLGGQFGREPIGTGPFRFVSWQKGREIRLQANDAYFEGRPYLDQLRYQVFPRATQEAIFSAFERGELEDVGIPIEKREEMISSSRYRFFRKPILGTRFLLFNTSTGLLSQAKVRQAINSAIQHEHLLRTVWHNRPTRANGILPPGIPGYNPGLSGYRYDLDRARQLLMEADLPDSTELRPIELWSSGIDPAVQIEHKAIQAALAKVGIPVTLHQTRSWREFKTKILGQRLNAMYRYAWHADFPDPDNFLYMLFHPQGAHNNTHYSNEEVNRLLERARREGDVLRRSELYREAERLIVQDAPMVSLVHFTFERLFQPYVRGVELNALGRPYMPMKKIWLDKAHPSYPQVSNSK